MKVCSKRNEDLKANAELSESKAMNGVNQIIYKFDNNVLAGKNLINGEQTLTVDGINTPVSLTVENPYSDMCD